MDVKAEIEKIIAKATKDSGFKEKLTKDPAGTVKGIVGDIDKESLEKIVNAVKSAGVADKLQGALGSLLGGKKD